MLSAKKADTYELAAQEKIVAPEKLASFAKKIRASGQEIATINGSFDLLHPGHLDLLYKASLQADVLLVLLNSDASIQGYKSKDRPINPLKVRLMHMAAIGFVDYVSWFDKLDPREVLQVIRPDVHVNGSEYGEDCIEAATVKGGGGRLHLVELIEGYSTTNLIKRIQGRCDS